MEYIALFKVLLASLASGVGLGILAYASKAQKGEAFNGGKLAKTGFIGGVVGILMHMSGQTISAENYQVYLMANTGVIYLLDKLWSLVRNSIQKKMITGAIFVVMLSSGCAGLGGNTVVPKTTGEKLAYAEATLTGLTLATINLNEARLIPLEKIKKFEVIITQAELSLKLGRLALVAHNAEGALEQLLAVQDILLELNSFIELKRNDYLDQPLPINGDPVPLPAGGDS